MLMYPNKQKVSMGNLYELGTKFHLAPNLNYEI